MAAENEEQGRMSLPYQAIIVLCLVGAVALILCAWALARHFFDEPSSRSPETNAGPDGYTQAQYMRLVRLRNQEAIQAKYGCMDEYPYRQNSKVMTQSSFMSV